MDFIGKIVLVTGSSRGIGAAIIRDFAKCGANVIINYVNDYSAALRLQEDIKCYNVESLVVKCDISCEDEVINMFNEISKKFGKIDILVNNAGISMDSMFSDKSVSDFRRVIDVNLVGTFIVSKYASKYMKKGHIINISSTNAIDTYYPESMDYDASKAGVISLTHNLAKELAPNILVNAILPGWIKTDMNKNIDENDYINSILLKRFGTVEEISSAVLFLASSTYITNTTLRVDGGELQ